MLMVSEGPSATAPALDTNPRTETVIGWSITLVDKAVHNVAGMVQTVDVV